MTDCLIIFGPLLCVVAAMSVGFGVNYVFAYRENNRNAYGTTARRA